ncbi:uncharacterized protein TNCV_1934311 [Trichonephila clavipes]|nr:uncharacterized protein TNCV_1934311 [Trichonephila clavipes]
MALRSSPASVCGYGSPVVKVWDHGRHVMSSSSVPLKTRRVGQRCTLNLSRAETSSLCCGVVVRRGGISSGVVHVTSPLSKITWSVGKSPHVAEQCDVNIHSLPRVRILFPLATKLACVTLRKYDQQKIALAILS